MPSKVAMEESDAPIPMVPKKTYKPNYRCIVPDSANVKSECDDFFLPYKDADCEFRCPSCGSYKLMPLY